MTCMMGYIRFEFAKENDVILVDEYDTIEESLLPFRGLSPTLLRHRNSLLPSSNLYTDSWTVTVKDGNASLSGKYAHLARALDQKELMDRYVRWLPDMSWTVNVHDGPSLVVDYRLRSRLVEAAGRGECKRRSPPLFFFCESRTRKGRHVLMSSPPPSA